MSKKKMSRTVIEGGRYGRNKWERRHSHDEERASERDYCTRAAKDPESTEDDNFIESKPKVYKDFRDKLSPMYRWLHAQVGRRWDDVHSEVKQNFDTRTTAGRHIVYDHLLSSVSLVNDPWAVAYSYRYIDETTSRSPNDFYVDDDGYLRVKNYLSRKRAYPPLEKFDTKRIINWLSGRAVGKIGDKLYWFVASDKNKKRGGSVKQWTCTWGQYTSYYDRYKHLNYHFLSEENIYLYNQDGTPALDERGKRIIKETRKVWRQGTPNFRQDRKLNEKELQFWNSMPSFYQEKVLEWSPVNPAPKKDPYRY